MSRTRHHSRNHGSPAIGEGNRRRAFGWEYWGKEAPTDCSKDRFSRERRIRKKAQDRKVIQEALRD